MHRDYSISQETMENQAELHKKPVATSWDHYIEKEPKEKDEIHKKVLL